MQRGLYWYPPEMEYNRYRQIPNALRQYREQRGLSQKEVAQFLGFKDKTWVSHWENGDALPNLVSAIRLSMLYQVPIEELFNTLTNTVRGELTGQ